MKRGKCYYKINKGLVFRREGKEGLLFNPDTGEIATLNETGVFIWKMCKKKTDLNEIVKNAIKRYRVKKEQAKREISKFLKQMVKVSYIIKSKE